MPQSQTSPTSRKKAFTLLELLVAVTVLIVLALLMTGIVESTSKVATLSHRRMAADSDGRQVLDRIGLDLEQMLKRTDFPDHIEKTAGNDRLTFFAQAEGYGGDRGISEICYEVEGNAFRRGALGSSWDSDAGAPGLTFNAPESTDIEEENFETVAPDVFRFEVAFLMADGSIRKTAPRMIAPADTPDSQTVRALIVGIVALDRKARRLLPDGDVSSLAALFTDAEDGKDLLKQWDGALQAADLPPPVRSGVQAYQRYYFLNQ